MGEPVLEVYLAHQDSGLNESYARLQLPASHYVLRDALEKAQLEPADEMLVGVMHCYAFPYLEQYLEDVKDLMLLNALAARLSEMEPWQKDTFEGLLLMEAEKQEPVALSRLYDLAANADKCVVLYAATNDRELGEFYAENDFLPELAEVPDSVMEILDYEKIGRKMRIGEGGVFLRHGSGYVTQVEEIAQAFSALDLELKAPDYAALLEVSVPDTERSEMLSLPCEKPELNAVLDRLEVNGWQKAAWRCADCRIPALADTFSLSDNMAIMNYAARMLSELSQEDTRKLKSLVRVTEVGDLEAAVSLMESLDDYQIRDSSSTRELAKRFLSASMSEDEIDLLLPHLNSGSYCTAMAEQIGAVLTPYGLVERWDGLPVIREASFQSRQESDGMSMEL